MVTQYTMKVNVNHMTYLVTLIVSVFVQRINLIDITDLRILAKEVGSFDSPVHPVSVHISRISLSLYLNVRQDINTVTRSIYT